MSKEVIFQTSWYDLEFAVSSVSTARDRLYRYCQPRSCHVQQLLIKCYLVVGEYQKAEQLATDLINNHGFGFNECSV